MLFCCKNSIKAVKSSLKIEFTTLIHILTPFSINNNFIRKYPTLATRAFVPSRNGV